MAMISAVIFALLAALLFALAVQNHKTALAHLDDLTGTFISVATMALTFWLIGVWQLRWEFWQSDAIWFFVIAGLLFPALGQRFQIAAVRHVGPVLTSAFGAFLPLFASLPAILFLGEEVGLLQALGIGLLISGLLLGALARGISWKARAFYLIFLPLGAALVRATTQPLSKAGYNILPEPLFGTMVVTLVSTLVVSGMIAVSGSPRKLAAFGKGHVLFAINGFLTGAGIYCIQLSLLNGSVTTTSSLVATAPIWSLVMGALYFKNEPLRWWHAVVVFAVSAGAIMVVVGQSTG